MSNSDSVPPQSEVKTAVKETLEDQASSPLVDSRNVEDAYEDGGVQFEGEEGPEEEEEGECGFCLFMKAGGCKDSFIAWEQCIEEAEKKKDDVVEKCFQVTSALKKCMEANSDYYEPILRAEKNAEEEAMKQLEEEAASSNSKHDSVDRL